MSSTNGTDYSSLISKVWNYAHILRDQGISYGDYVERAEQIRPALERAQKRVDEGMVALVNVKTDYRARAGTVAFSDYST